jgi:uncharacterized protein (TIGR03437 family)
MRLSNIACLLPICALVCSSQVVTPSHRIGVHTVNGVGVFYLRDTGAAFVPRGNTFVRLSAQVRSPAYGGTKVVTHSLFNAGAYNAQEAEAELVRMQSYGYNTVRVFLNPCCSGGIGNPTGGLSQSYLTNVADFLGRAKAHALFVHVVGGFIPEMGGYDAIVTPDTAFAFPNILYMTDGGIKASAKFWTDIIRDLSALQAPLDVILGIDVGSEISFDVTAAPLNRNTGTVKTADGKTYDLSDATSRQALMDSNLVNFINQVRSAIIAVDPTMLVAASFSPPQGPNPTPFADPAHKGTRAYPAICCSTADFIDLHPYLWGLTLPQLMQNYEFSGFTAKPVVMFEYGVSLDYPLNYAGSAEGAAGMLQKWQTTSCSYGFSGWLLWNWDQSDASNIDVAYWSALAGNGAVNRALAPAFRPDPCKPGSYLNQDLAFAAAAAASSYQTDHGPPMAVDGSPATWWSAGAFAPQWIQIDLPAPSIVTGVRLTVSQSPNGPTVHDLYVRRQGDSQPELVREFSGTTQDQQVLTWTADQPLDGVTSIRIATVASPSWVAWREIEILSGDTGRPSISSVVNGASFDAAITPGSWVTIQGTGLAASSRIWQASDFNGAHLPMVLDGVRVSIDGAPASVYYVSPTQLNVQAPSPIHTGQAVAVTVARDNAQTVASVQVESKTYDPALFGYTASGLIYTAAVFPDGTVVGDPAKTAGTRGARPGDRVSLWGTAFGASPSGVVINSPTALSNPVVVTVGGQRATVEYAGLVGVGLFQINIVVPNLPVGDHPVTIQFQGASAATSPSIPIR